MFLNSAAPDQKHPHYLALIKGSGSCSASKMSPFTASIAKYSTLLIVSVLTSYLAYEHLTKQLEEKASAKMAELKVGDSLPNGVTFSYVPYTPENGDITSCGIPINYDASKGSQIRQFLLMTSPCKSHFISLRTTPRLPLGPHSQSAAKPAPLLT